MSEIRPIPTPDIAANPYDDAILRHGEQQQADPVLTVPEGPSDDTGGEYNPYDASIERAGDSSSLRDAVALQFGDAMNPEEEARLVRFSRDHGVPLPLVRENIDELERLAPKVDPWDLIRRSPKTAKWMAQNAGVAVDDSATLEGLEWVLKAGHAALGYGAIQGEYGVKAYGQMEGLFTGEKTEARLKQIEQEVLPLYFGADNWLETAYIEAMKMIPQMAAAAGAAGLSAFAAGQLGPQAGIPEELISVPGAAAFGAWNWTRIQEAGFAWREFKDLTDENGNRISPEQAYLMAHFTGAVNGGLELVGFNQSARMIPGAKQWIGSVMRRRVADIVADPAFRRGVRKFTKERALRKYGVPQILLDGGMQIGKGVAAESGTEMLQELTPIFGRMALQQFAGGQWRDEDWEQNIGEILEVGKNVMLGTAFLGSASYGPKFGVDLAEANRIRSNAARMESLRGLTLDSKLAKRLPEDFQDFVRTLKEEQGAIENVFVPVAEWNAIMGKAGADPRQVAEDVFGETEQYDQAMREGGLGDLVIPLETYLTELADKPVHDELSGVFRLNQGGMTWSEFQKAATEQGEAMATALEKIETLEEFDQDERLIYAEEFGKIHRATGDPIYADAAARVPALVMSHMARRAGRDPVEFYRQYQVNIKSPETAAVAEPEVQPLDALLAEKPGESAILKELLDKPTTLQQPAAGEPKLSVLHNLTEENLQFASKLGGIAAPSLAVVPEDVGLEKYGPITLIGRPELGDPEKTPVFDADAYSATFPRPNYKKVPLKATDAFIRDVRPWAEKYGEVGRVVQEAFDYLHNTPDPDRVLSIYRRSLAVRAWWLKETDGIDIDPVMRERRSGVPWVDTDAFRSFLANNPWQPSFEYEGDYHEMLSDAVLTAMREYADFRSTTDGSKADPEIADVVFESYKKRFFDEDKPLIHFSAQIAIQRGIDSIGKMDVDHTLTEEAIEKAIGGRTAQFNSWLEKKVIPLYGAPRIKVAGRLKPYTLENIVRVMTSGKTQAAEKTLTQSTGLTRAAAAVQFNNLETLRRVAGRDIKQESDLEAGRSVANEALERYREAVLPYTTKQWSSSRGLANDTWAALDASMEALAAWATAKVSTPRALAQALRRRDFVGVPDEVVALGVKAGEALLNAPVPYFEAKPQRAVMLNEFAGAVVPDDVTPEALEILKANNIPHTTYGKRFDEKARFDAVKRMRGDLAKSGVLTLYQDVLAEEALRLYQEDDAPRGDIAFLDDLRSKRFDITLFEASDPSTLLHEMSHFYLEMLGDLAEVADAKPDIARDYKTALKWMADQTGERIKSRDDIYRVQKKFNKAGKRDQGPMERWAQAYESYLASGKAPREDVRRLFSQIREWMLRVYRRLENMLPISDEIRGVFDRMMATDEQTAEARRQLALEPMPEKHMDLLGLTEAERAVRRETERKAQQEEREEVEDVVRGHHGEVADWLKEKKREITEEVERELDKSPVMRALHYLTKGHFYGEELPGDHPLRARPRGDNPGPPRKLSKATLVKQYGIEVLNDLGKLSKRYLYADDTKSGKEDRGITPDSLAMTVGYEGGGDALVAALRGAAAYEKIVADGVEQRVESRFGEMDFDEVARQALTVVSGDKRTEQLLTDMRLIARKLQGAGAKRQPVTAAQLKRAAEQAVGGRRVNELRPDIYKRATDTHGRRAFAALEKGDLATAYSEKLLQARNLAMYRATRDMTKKMEVLLRYFRRMQKTPAQAVLGKAGVDYQVQANKIMEQYRLRDPKRPMPAMVKLNDAERTRARTKALRDWLTEIERETNPDYSPEDGIPGSGVTSLIAESVLDRQETIHFREATVQELLDASDAVKNIEHLARLKTHLLHNGKMRERAEITRELVASLEANTQGIGKFERVPSKRGRKYRAAEWMRAADARVLRMEELIDRLDGRDVRGPWTTYLWEPIVKAQAEENDLTLKITMKLAEAFDALPKAHRDNLFDQVHIKTLGTTIGRQEILAIALNTGNESNMQRAVENGFDLGPKWSVEALSEILDKLTKEDWVFVQNIWDTLESLWPEIAKLQFRMTGIEPTKIPREPRTVLSGTHEIQGGYYPLVYNELSGAGQKQLKDATATQVLYDHGHAQAMTSHGFTKDRVKKYSGKLSLDLNVIVRHTNQVIHDLTHREAILNIDKILKDYDVREAIYDRLGREYYEMFEKWLRGIASDRLEGGDRFIEGMMRGARMNATAVAMCFKATVSMQNLANVSNVLEKVPPGQYARAMKQILLDLPGEMDRVHELSGEMRHRFANLERDIRDAMQRDMNKQFKGKAVNEAQKLLYASQQFGYSLIAFTDKLTAYPGWIAAYNDAVGKGMSEGKDGDARKHADRVIRTTLSAGAPKDIAQVQRGSEFQKAITMFYSWFSTAHSRFSALGYDIKTGRGKEDGRVLNGLPWFLGRIMSFWIIPATVAELLAHRGPDDWDEPEDWAEWAALKAATYPMLTLPFVRDLGNAAESVLGGSHYFGAKFGVLGDFVNAFRRLLQDLKNVATGEEITAERAAKDLTNGLGYALGLPTSQFKITFGYWYELMDGNAEAEDVWDFLMKSMYYRERDE